MECSVPLLFEVLDQIEEALDQCLHPVDLVPRQFPELPREKEGERERESGGERVVGKRLDSVSNRFSKGGRFVSKTDGKTHE